MYREAGERAEAELPPRELVYEVAQRDHASSAGTTFRLFGLPIVGAVGLAAFLSPEAGLVGLVGGAALSYLSWRSARAAAKIRLRVDDGVLVVGAPGEEKRVRLSELADVALDIKTIRRVQEGSSAIPAMRFLDSRVGPEVDLARIVLVRDDQPDLPLTEDHVAHMDATEWLGKIRVFLRKHGWLPEDEATAALD